MIPRSIPAVLLASLVTVWACSAGEVAEDPAADFAQVEEEPDTTPAEVIPASLTTISRPEIFPHGPHQRVDCLSCHTLLPTHQSHADVNCTECHAIPERFQSLRPLGEQECMTCHHVQQRDYQCADCHSPGEIAGPRVIETRMQVASWEGPRIRELPFDHVRHTERKCLDCHAAAAIPVVTAECRSCHEPHHQLASTCSECHVPADTTVHAEAAHRGCGGAGCHVNATVAAFPPVQQVCRMCHAVAADHHPGEECADCHTFGAWRSSDAPESREPSW